MQVLGELDDKVDPNMQQYLVEQSINLRERAVTIVSELNDSLDDGSCVQYKVKGKLDQEAVKEYAESFFFETSEEIKKVFIYYTKKEKELFVSLNSILHLEQNYKTFNDNEKGKVFNQIGWVVEETNNLIDLSSLNFRSIQLVLDSFEERLGKKSQQSSFVYLQKLLNRGNSDLKYLITMSVGT